VRQLRLCLALGYPTRRALLNDARLNAIDLAEWEAYERIEGPIGLGRVDDLVRFAIQAMMAVQARSGRDFAELLPAWWRDDEEPELVEDEEAAAELGEKLRRALGG
jgi:hypothetical protein